MVLTILFWWDSLLFTLRAAMAMACRTCWSQGLCLKLLATDMHLDACSVAGNPRRCSYCVKTMSDISLFLNLLPFVFGTILTWIWGRDFETLDSYSKPKNSLFSSWSFSDSSSSRDITFTSLYERSSAASQISLCLKKLWFRYNSRWQVLMWSTFPPRFDTH